MQTIRFDNLELDSGSSVLDMGCGEGRHTIGLFIDKQINAFGFDLSIDDLNIARSRLDDFPVQKNDDSACIFGLSNILINYASSIIFILSLSTSKAYVKSPGSMPSDSPGIEL